MVKVVKAVEEKGRTEGRKEEASKDGATTVEMGAQGCRLLDEG